MRFSVLLFFLIVNEQYTGAGCFYWTFMARSWAFVSPKPQADKWTRLRLLDQRAGDLKTPFVVVSHHLIPLQNTLIYSAHAHQLDSLGGVVTERPRDTEYLTFVSAMIN